MKRKDWIFGPYPAQDVLMIEMVRWQEVMSESILKMAENKDSLQNTQTWYGGLMSNMVEIVRADLNLL